MKSANDAGLFTKGPQFIKPTAMFFGAARIVKPGHAGGDISIQSPPVTASERAFLDSHAN